MRIAVMGTGAVGGYFGARLAAAGHDVAFIARGERLANLRAGGLNVKSIAGDLHIRRLFTSKPEDVGRADLILFCVKCYDTNEAASNLTPLIGDNTIILSLQNGIDNPKRIVDLWPKNLTLAGVVYIGARITASGLIEHVAAGRIALGELQGHTSEPTKTLHQALCAAQIPCTISTEIQKAMWGKLVWNAPFCAISSLTRATVREILESDSLNKVALDCMHEVKEAAKQHGVDLGPSAIEETMDLSRGLGDFKPSMLQDLEAGKPLEYEAFNGVVVKSFREVGKRCPVNEIFYAALKFLDEKIRKRTVK